MNHLYQQRKYSIDSIDYRPLCSLVKNALPMVQGGSTGDVSAGVDWALSLDESADEISL